MSLLQMSFAGAVMILAITVIRALAINLLPKKTFLALWGITVVRLLLPFSLPSTFSVYSLLAQHTPVENVVKDTLTANPLPIEPAGQMATIPGNISNPVIAIPVWTAIWAIGVLVCALVFVIAYWKCRQEFQTSLPVEHDFAKNWLNACRLKRPISIRQSSRFSTPLTYGVFRPVILMPTSTEWENTKSLQYVLTHEYVHIRRFDSITKLVLIAALCVHWFNPLVWAMYILANRDIELSCDEAVVRLFGENTKAAYARTLISMEETRSGLTPLCNNFSKNAIEERITAIMKIKKVSMLSLVLALALVFGVTTAFATSANAQAGQEINDISMTETALQRLEHQYPDVARWVRECYPDAVWWTYEGYQQMMAEQKECLEIQIGENIGWTPSTGDITITPKYIKEVMAEHEQVLDQPQNGIMFSKSIDGDENLGTSFNPVDIALGTGNRELR